jgi:hypothetical protein
MASEDQKQEKPKSIIELMQEKIANMEERLESVEKRPTAKRQLFGGKTERHVIVDTKTNAVYVSLSAIGKSLAKEFGFDPGDKFVWYKIRAKDPGRFREATEDEKAKALADYEAKIAAEQAKLEAENKAAEDAAAKAATGAPANHPTSKKIPGKKG